MPTPHPRLIEITDLLGTTSTGDAGSLAAVEARLRDNGQGRAARIVAGLHDAATDFTGDQLDDLVLTVHCELQRLEEELQMPRIVTQTLAPLVAKLKPGPGADMVRVVDVGCGLGYLVRWLTHFTSFGEHVELVGADLDGGLIEHARRLAAAEGIDCSFAHGDAFEVAETTARPERTIVISSGLLHHLDPERLSSFFATQQRLGVAAFAHWDLTPTRWARLGAWAYHRARARHPITRHDGVVSAERAYTAPTLLAAARHGAPDYRVQCEDGSPWIPNPLRVLRPITGLSQAVSRVAL